jgi:hypothetical protein
MRIGRIRLLVVSLIASVAAFSACAATDDGSDTGNDAGDGSNDGPDTGNDAAIGNDATVVDATADAATNGATSDGGQDATSDALSDGASAGGSDAATDGGMDATAADAGDAGACAPNETRCSGMCVNTTSNSSHCGMCDRACTAANNQCVASACELKRLTPVWEKTLKRVPVHFVGEHVSIGAIASDPNDHVIISGSCAGQTPSGCTSTGYDFGGGIRTGRSYIAAFDADGTYLWDRVFATAAGMRLATDVAGNVYIARTVGAGTVDFGGGPRVVAGSALAVVSYDTTGAFRWDHLVEYAGTATASALAIAAGAVDEVTVGGSKNGSVDFGGGVDIGRDGFILSLGAAGAYRWSKMQHPGVKSEADVRSVAVDKTGQVTVVGECAGTVDLGGGVKNNCTSFMAAYAADGTWLWDLVPGTAVGIGVDVSNDTISAGSAVANVRRDPAGATVFTVASAQTNGCAGSLCPILPFAISPTYDELWYVASPAGNSPLGRRSKSNGTGPQPWGAFSTAPMFGSTGRVNPTGLRVLVSGDVVSGGGYATPGSTGGYAYLARFARPL